MKTKSVEVLTGILILIFFLRLSFTFSLVAAWKIVRNTLTNEANKSVVRNFTKRPPSIFRSTDLKWRESSVSKMAIDYILLLKGII